jgi:hypothetical protein
MKQAIQRNFVDGTRRLTAKGNEEEEKEEVFNVFVLLARGIALCSVLLTKYNSGDQVKKTEMGRACGTYGREERCIQGFSGET